MLPSMILRMIAGWSLELRYYWLWHLLTVFKVYDVTQFVNDHPGGLESIVRRSGVNRDATVGFQGGQHPDTVEDQIRQYLCGKLKEYSRAEIAKHNKKDDCWLIIDDKVYDVTKFIADHPGGEIILKNAGADSSEGFHRVEAHTRIGKEDNTYSGAQVKMGALLIGALKTEERKAKKQ